MRSALSGGVAIAVLLVVTVAHGQDARDWLERMSRAVEDLNYHGTFVHVVGDSTETLRIIHRNEGGEVGERIMSLDGVGREIVRQQNRVQCVLPDRKVVLVEDTRDASPLVSSLPNYSEQLEANYKFKVYSEARVLDRRTQVIGITPRDPYRYGYLLWLDHETGMPLKTQLWGDRKTKLEEILFTSIEFPESIPSSAIVPDTDGYTIIESLPEPAEIAQGIPWRFTELPQGFQREAVTSRRMAGSQYPVEHIVFSDGLATVSVFIEDPKTEANVAEGFSTVGSTNAYSLTLAGRKVTVVGEVPRRTVERIAASLSPE
jgi:sigma-E factor negative regulatory protein RseB